MEKIQEFATFGQNEKFSKTEKIQTFKMNKTRITQEPVKCGKTKESQGKTKQNREQKRSSKSLTRTGEEAHDSCPFKMV